MSNEIKYFRVDGNNEIGIGHVMRCLSIAEALRQKGEECAFIVSDNSVRNLIEQNNFNVICLNSSWNNLEQETDILCDEIKNRNISTLIIDSYYVTEAYLQAIRKFAKIAYIDDLNSFLYPVGLLINYNLYSSIFNYEENYKAAGFKTSFALGSEFIPLRKEFISVKAKREKNVKKIFITTGGTDHYNVAGSLLDRLSACNWFNNIDYNVIVGKFNKNKSLLINKWKTFKNVHLICDTNNMSDYMKECDIAVTAGGVTVYELMACGIPSVMYTLADNQENAAKIMSQTGLINYAGDIRNNITTVMEAITKEVERLYENYELRVEISNQLQRAVDGNGSFRLAEKILNM